MSLSIRDEFDDCRLLHDFACLGGGDLDLDILVLGSRAALELESRMLGKPDLVRLEAGE